MNQKAMAKQSFRFVSGTAVMSSCRIFLDYSG